MTGSRLSGRQWPSAPVPDATTIGTFGEAPTKAGAPLGPFELFDRKLRSAAYLAMPGQLLDATIVAAPKQRNPRADKQAITDGRVPEDWQDRQRSSAGVTTISIPWHQVTARAPGTLPE